MSHTLNKRALSVFSVLSKDGVVMFHSPVQCIQSCGERLPVCHRAVTHGTSFVVVKERMLPHRFTASYPLIIPLGYVYLATPTHPCPVVEVFRFSNVSSLLLSCF